MYKLLFASLLLFSQMSFARTDCSAQVEKVANQAHNTAGGLTVLQDVRATDDFFKGGQNDLQVYKVELSIDGSKKYIYDYYVNPETCETKSMSLVYAED